MNTCGTCIDNDDGLCDRFGTQVEKDDAACKNWSDHADDQKAKADGGKAKLSLVPSAIIYAIARIREYGVNKYPDGGRNNWKQVEPERYRDAMYRHLLAYINDPHGVDQESGLPHLWHLACNAAFLCELEEFDEAVHDSHKG